MDCVIITGAAGGIGQALVREFAASGHAVIATDRLAMPPGLPCDAFVQCDLDRLADQPAYATDVFARVRAALADRPLAGLVNNAAVQVLGRVETLGRDAWHETLAVNLLAPFLWTQSFLAELQAARGCVLNIGSIHSRLTKPEFVAYATSKAALSGMTRAMAVELGGRVRINAIEPAAIETPMLQAGFAGNEAGYDALKRYHPTGSIGSATELAKLAALVIGLPGTFANGSIIAFDGGIGAVLHDPG